MGAPYEKNGVVYIYLGSRAGLKSEPSQIIDAGSLRYPMDITTFGYSLSGTFLGFPIWVCSLFPDNVFVPLGNLDLDRNSYPDLLIGAYESDAVILLRSRPIIKIKTSVKGNLTQIDPNSKGCVDDPQSKTACFSVQPCFKLLGNSKVSKLQYRIEAETFTGKRLTKMWNIWLNVNNLCLCHFQGKSITELCSNHLSMQIRPMWLKGKSL